MKTKLHSKIKLLALGAFAFSQAIAQTTFSYTGGVQTYTVPPGAFSLTIDAKGAQGGFGYAVPAVGAGQGGRVQATLAVTPGEVLNIYLGGQGGPGGTTVGGTAGYNGGGTGGGWSGGRSGGGGGGASDIRQGGTALSNRVIIAAGGGGTGVNYSTGNRGGDGGGLTGANGLTGTYLGAGATQSAGGAPNGALGQGGNAPAGQTGGGGGGGYYGGGASAWEGGGGGSSYTATVGVTSVTHTAGFQLGNGQIVITPIISFYATVTQSATIQCFGQSTASLTATPNGGTSPYTYSWAPSGGTAATASGLAAGTYTVTVTDANLVATTQSFTVTQPTAVVASPASQTNISCFGGSNGSASVTAAGGTGAFTYAWAPSGGTSATASTLVAGVYTVTVTDANSCATTQTFNITAPSALVASATAQTNVSCNGGTNGSATVTASGGAGGYSYSWSPSGGSAATASGLSAGTYTVNVMDANFCSTTQTFTLTEPPVLSGTASSTAILCYGDSALITLTVTGGTSPYTGTGPFTVGAGMHTFIVTDANGCTTTINESISQPAAIATSSTQTNVSCFGGSNGMIDLTVTGGTGPFTFNWNNGLYTTEDLTGLSAGSYSGILTDANGCQDSGTIVILQPTLLTTTVTPTGPTTCGGTNGTIDLAVTGGTPGYTYMWSNSATTQDINGIGAGNYSCTVTDANGCTTQFGTSVADPASPTVTLSLAINAVCVTDGVYTLTGGSPLGGTFSGPGVTGTSFNPTTAGVGSQTITYSYTDSQTGCIGTNADIVVVDPCVGINSAEANEQSFILFPNPNNGSFTLQLTTTKMADVFIYDAIGQLVAADKIYPQVQQQINIETAGVYMITVVTADGARSSQRVVVNK
jgi:hypothetical protein